MAEEQIWVRCYHCGGDTAYTVQVLEDPDLIAEANKNPSIDKSVTCTYCGYLNIFTIPASWDGRPLVLDDDGFLGYNQGQPIVQGKRG